MGSFLDANRARFEVPTAEAICLRTPKRLSLEKTTPGPLFYKQIYARGCFLFVLKLTDYMIFHLTRVVFIYIYISIVLRGQPRVHTSSAVARKEVQSNPHQSLPPLEGPSTVSWFIVMACTVVMSPSTMPNLSFNTFSSRHCIAPHQNKNNHESNATRHVFIELITDPHTYF